MMRPARRQFEPEDYPQEVFRPEDPAAAVRAVRRGELRRLFRGLYTWNVDAPPGEVARRRWRELVELLFPRAVIVDRTAVDAKPAVDGSVFVDAGPAYTTNRPIKLPGLTIRPRRGPGALPGDMPFGTVHLSSPARAALDNTRRSRARGGVARTLAAEELEAWLERIAAQRGEQELLALREQAREIAPRVPGTDLEMLDRVIGALLGTRDAALRTSSGRARHARMPYDARRLEVFERLRAELAGDVLALRSEPRDPERAFAFYEAYCSNFIEGTEFEVSEAEEIIFDGVIPAQRPEDAHDILGTYQLITDPIDRAAAPQSADDLLEILQRFNARIMADRPEQRPGQWKERGNQAGGTVFVRPEMVRGTLRAAWPLYATLPEGLGRAIFAMVLTTEVHPFGDGNGRTARALLGAELSRARECRIIIPLVYRADYLGALRRFSREGDCATVVRMLDRAQRWAAAVDWSSRAAAHADLVRTNALIAPEDEGRVLRDPG